MTEVTDQELTERAAKGVMGWSEDYKGKRHRVGQDVFDPLNLWAHAGLLVEKIREMPEKVQCLFEHILANKWAAEDRKEKGPTYTLWLTPRHLTIAACEAVGKETG